MSQTEQAAANSPIDQEIAQRVAAVAKRSRKAARVLAVASRAAKDQALNAMANALVEATAGIVQQNVLDLETGRQNGLTESLLDRLTLTPGRIKAVAAALRDLAVLPDPVGEVVRGSTLPNGLKLRQVRVPMGVVGMIYEARPNVTVDAAGLGLKSGNAVILRGGSAAERTNRQIIAVLRQALSNCGLPEDAVQTIDQYGREGVRALMRARGLVDLLVPRGGAGLIQSVVMESLVPVIETGVGNCHVYVHSAADLDKAVAIAVNSKVQRPSVCNAAETLLADQAVAERFLPRVLQALSDAGVELHVDAAAGVFLPSGVAAIPASDQDWATEYLDLKMAVGVVDGLEGAIQHIQRWSSSHTEAIVTQDLDVAEEFASRIDSASIMINASTRFTDGGEFGLGAEIGISTQKLHARGPMGLTELTSSKWITTGNGHIRE
ncbi:MAG: glutamate-5-semialdehyde dehydrogenase [Micrococcales bacterium]|nr:glutamate-5-semialdehyde dehydrogenase [Micrococcales bacterium]